jgi:hypothetical protein
MTTGCKGQGGSLGSARDHVKYVKARDMALSLDRSPLPLRRKCSFFLSISAVLLQSVGQTSQFGMTGHFMTPASLHAA